ncbi:EcsC family protein OS=Streptomyces violarus OX=67380 GN=FHS41_001959 PE=4 SV=1 [Streptomyces violarus]
MDSARKGSVRARAGLAHLADRIIDLAPRVPVRDLATLRRQFPGLGPEELADKLVAGAAKATATVGAGIGAAAMLPVPPAMPTELAAEITGVAAIELKLIAELHEVYGVRPPGNIKQRSTAYLHSWSGERGIDATKPSTLSTALNSRMKRDLRQRIMKRMVRSMPNLVPFMIGAAVGAAMNRSETRKLAVRIREDLRRIQVPWDALEPLPALERPADALEMGEITDDPLGRLGDDKPESEKHHEKSDKRDDGH